MKVETYFEKLRNELYDVIAMYGVDWLIYERIDDILNKLEENYINKINKINLKENENICTKSE